LEDVIRLSPDNWHSHEFERHRPQLRAVAYRMLGSLTDADDAVQEAWLRFNRSDEEAIDNLGAWLTTVVGRVCIDMLRARRSRREDQFEPSLPEPIVSVDVDEEVDPERQALLADTVGIALLVVLDTLSPSERLAYVLHDMFGVRFDEIAPIVERSPEAARQLASRARRRVRGAAPETDGDLGRQRAAVDAFLMASREGNFDALLELLDPDVVFRADAGRALGLVEPRIAGAEPVARYASVQGHRFATLCHPALVNGEAGLIIQTSRGPIGAVAFTVSHDRITTIDLILDPDKLGGVETARRRA
jgi:RNA polymerase sigma-70 factor (ECF subfamily)